MTTPTISLPTTPRMLLLVSQYGDPILFTVEPKTHTVHIAGAERSFGIKWATGHFSPQLARELWELVIGGGGRAADPSIVAKIAAVADDLTANMREALLQAQDDLIDFQKRLETVRKQVEDAQRHYEQQETLWSKEIDIRVTEAVEALMRKRPDHEVYNAERTQD
jgi:hypothetical protein